MPPSISMDSIETKLSEMTNSEKDALLFDMLKKREATMKRAHASRMVDEARRKRHNQTSVAAHTRKYRNDPEYRKKILENNRQRYWEKKRKGIEDKLSAPDNTF